MPKRKSTTLDTVQNAHRIVLQSVGAIDDTPQPEIPSRSTISQVMAEMGRKGGKIGGKRRLVTMTGARRRQVAKLAARARWSKRKKKSAA